MGVDTVTIEVASIMRYMVRATYTEPDVKSSRDLNSEEQQRGANLRVARWPSSV